MERFEAPQPGSGTGLVTQLLVGPAHAVLVDGGTACGAQVLEQTVIDGWPPAAGNACVACSRRLGSQAGLAAR